MRVRAAGPRPPRSPPSADAPAADRRAGSSGWCAGTAGTWARPGSGPRLGARWRAARSVSAEQMARQAPHAEQGRPVPGSMTSSGHRRDGSTTLRRSPRAPRARRRSRACEAAGARGRASAPPAAGARPASTRREQRLADEAAPARRPGQPCGPWLKWLKDQSSAARRPRSTPRARSGRRTRARSRSRWWNVFTIRTWVPAGTAAPSQLDRPRASRGRASASSATAASPPRGRPRGSRAGDVAAVRPGVAELLRHLAALARVAGEQRQAAQRVDRQRVAASRTASAGSGPRPASRASDGASPNRLTRLPSSAAVDVVARAAP